MYRLIIADDEAEIRNGLMNIVPWARWGFVVDRCFSSGHEAIEYLKDHDADAALLDIVMDEGTGLDVAMWLREHRRRTRVLLLSGYSDFTYARQAIQHGVWRYLLKPTEMHEVQSTFEELRVELDREAQSAQRRSGVLEVLLTAPSHWLEHPHQSISLFDEAEGAGYAMAALKFGDHETAALAASQHLGQWSWPVGWTVACCAMGAQLYVCVQAASLDELKSAFQERVERLIASWRLLSITVEVVYIGCAVAMYALMAACLAGINASRQSDAVQVLIAMLDADDADYTLTLQEWAAKLSVNPGYISRRFKEKTGDNFAHYYTRLRMQRAKHMLGKTQISVSQISRSLGYVDTKHFNQVFKKEFGSTPTQYRRAVGRS